VTLRRELEATRRISVPYGNKNSRFDATVGYDLGDFSVEAATRTTASPASSGRPTRRPRTGSGLAADVRKDWFVLHGGYEFGSRDYSGLEIERSEGRVFVTPGDPGQHLFLPFLQPVRGRRGLQPPLRPGPAPRQQGLRPRPAHARGHWSFDLSYIYDKSNFDDSAFGLQFARYKSFTAEAGLHPQREVERLRLLHLGRQQRLPVRPAERVHRFRAPPGRLDSNVDDKINSIGAGATISIVPSKWSLNLFARWAGGRRNNDFFAPDGGAPASGRVSVGGVKDIPNYDDTTLTTVSAELKYRLQRWGLALGGWYERYRVDDSGTEGLSNYIPSQFFLNAANGSYRAVWGYVRASYTW
jgi:hypothetical protein